MSRRHTRPGFDPSAGRRRGSRLLRRCIALALVAGSIGLGVSVVAPGLLPNRNDLRFLPPVVGGVLSPDGQPVRPPDRTVPVGLPHQVPVRVSIPRVGVSTDLTTVGLDQDGVLQVPTDDQTAGWYDDGPAPGDANGPPAVIVGHVDSYQGPAVFFGLRQVRPGDSVRVDRADGSTADFLVYRVAEYPKSTFPADQVYAPTPRAELRLITCSGAFDPKVRSYLSDLVVYATLRSPTSPSPTTPAVPAG
ncbi:MAG TPA: class F sortase [Mycobacteriales bacterium]